MITSSITSVSIFVFFCFLLTIPSAISLSFNLSRIGPADVHSINYTGGYISDQGIQVTTDERSQAQQVRAGRATYVEPLHLWNKASGSLADFSTHFSFVIDSGGRSSYADGLTFFLAPVGSTIQPWSFGGSLALGNGDSPVNSSSEAFVAVEFDTFRNFFDPPERTHVGIDVNSMISVATARWDNNITLGPQNDAWISYNASTGTLRVDFTGNSSNGTRRESLSHVVDLRQYLPEYVTVGFSAATGALFETHTVKSWAFNSSLILPSDNGGRGSKKGLVIGLSVGLSVLILASVFAAYCLRKKKKKDDKEFGDEEFVDPYMDIEFEKGSGPKKFPYSQLVAATKNFAEEEKLGEGGFGGVYRGFLTETESYIAVKRVSKGSKQGLKEYASEVKIISQLRHRNLVRLVGWCHERNELLLVYEYMPNGSLDSHLFKGVPPMEWEARFKIVQGLASALLYLHEEWERAVVHRDIKASNIMLDSSFNAKLGDFGLARLVDHEKGSQTTILAGTMGYMAPECLVTGRASKESDVYSFGIVLLEIACGRRTIERGCGENVVLVEWVWRLYGAGKLLDGTDPKLEALYDARQMECLMVVGLWCVHPDSVQRPSIRQAIHVLNFEAELPALPPMMPVPTYFPPRMSVHSGFVSDTLSYNHYSDSSNVASSSAGSFSARQITSR